MISGLHHIAIIAGDYARSKTFYTEVLPLTIVREVFRADRNSYKLDLALNGQYLIELFSFPGAPARPSRPEAIGLRHIAFAVPNLDSAITALKEKGIATEPVRIDPHTAKRFTFFADPDGLPIEFYEL
jgi:glyoxylase I family protein